MQVTVRIGGTREAVHATLIAIMAATQRTGAHTERLDDTPNVTEGQIERQQVDSTIRRMASAVNQRRVR